MYYNMNEDVESVHDFDKFTNRSQRSDFLINKFFKIKAFCQDVFILFEV